MILSNLLHLSGVKVTSALTSKKRLFHAIGELAGDAYGLDVPRVVSALQDREALGPTGVGNGVALPHARLDTITEVKGVFLRLDKPLEFSAVDRQPVDLVFGLFAPTDSGVAHLKALALVSRTLRDASVCAKLRANSDPATLHAILTEGPATQAA